MADPIDTGLLASIKALEDVVARSIDPANPLAREQVRLVSRYLAFLRQRLPFQVERDRFELRHALALAAQLREIAPDEASSILDEPVEQGKRVNREQCASPQAITAASRALNTAASIVVRCAVDYPKESQQAIERAIVKASQRLFDVQRAWYLPMGFEPDAATVMPLAQALSAPTLHDATE